jgi:hypothetical protein
MASLRSWWKQRAERRRVRQRYRSARSGWVRERVSTRLAPANLGLSVLLGLGGVLVYWGWAQVRSERFDLVAFWVIVIPPAAYILGTCAYYWTKAPAQLFEEQRGQLERFNPPIPWVVAVEVAEDERRIFVRLVPRADITGTTKIESATCFFAIREVRPACPTPKSGSLATAGVFSGSIQPSSTIQSGLCRTATMRLLLPGSRHPRSKEVPRSVGSFKSARADGGAVERIGSAS